MTRRIDIIVNSQNDGKRLDKVLPTTGLMSRNEARRLVGRGSVWVDGKRIKVSSRPMSKGQRIVVYLDPSKGHNSRVKIKATINATPQTSAQPLSIHELEILYKDKEVCAISKPAGLSSVATPRRDQGVVTTILKKQLGLERQPIPIHRLDRDTSGVMLLALTKKAAKKYTKLQMAGKVERFYTALGKGKVYPPRGQWEWPMARNPRRRDRWAVDPKRGKATLTRYQVGEQVPGFPSLFYYHLELVTGRTHQIRVHMAHAGVPVVGDPWYGGTRKVDHEKGTTHRVFRMCLHSRQYRVVGEASESSLDIRCEPPAPFFEILK